MAKVSDNTVKVVAIISLTVIALALIYDLRIDGFVISTITAIIGGIAGYSIGREESYRRRKKENH